MPRDHTDWYRRPGSDEEGSLWMRTRPFVFSVGVAASIVLFLAPPVGADLASTCPDQFVLLPAQSVEQGEKKDKNGNGFVCGKLEDGRIVGGPDEMIDDIII
jgi:hypothetical protein